MASHAARRVQNMAHWGAFTAEVANGRLVAAHPIARDRNPSPMIATIPGAVHHPSRIAQPMVRKGFLDRRENSDRTARGSDPFVPLAWDEALDLSLIHI